MEQIAVNALVSQDQSGRQAADLATLVRSRMKRPAPPKPRADGALGAAAGAIVAIVMAATSAAFIAPRLESAPAPEPVLARVGEIALAIPPALTGAAPDEPRLVGMARLRLDWPSLGAASTESDHRLLVTLSPPDKVNQPAAQLAIYARFLTNTVWSNPGDLVVRGFRKGSPFEKDELFVSVPDGRGFAARCPLESGTQPLDEFCRVTFNHRGLDVNIRFPRAIIADWQLMLGGVRRTIDGLIRSG